MSRNRLDKLAINFHFTRKCNFECKFCFHTKKTSHILPSESQLSILKQLRDAGAQKINFAGGEPFLYPEVLGVLVRGAKEMGFQSTSIISNGSLIKRAWMEKYGEWLDILGVSCDSINPNVNFEQGRRTTGSSRPIDQTDKIRECSTISKELGIHFKINTVVTSKNVKEDMSQFINELNPMRWKIFQVLDIDGENYNSKSNKNNIQDFLISKEEFDNYIKRNKEGLKDKDILKPEDNETMRSSYILIDEFGRFLDSSKGGKTHTKSILDVGLDEAFDELLQSEGKGFDKDLFEVRGGYFPEKWSKNSTNKML